MSENNVGTMSVEMTLDTTPLKRTLRNLLTAIEASENGVSVGADFCGRQPPTFGTVIDGKIFSAADIKAINEAIKSGKVIP